MYTVKLAKERSMVGVEKNELDAEKNFKPCNENLFNLMKRWLKKKNRKNVFLEKSYIKDGAIRWRASDKTNKVHVRHVVEVSKKFKRFIHINTGNTIPISFI